MKINRNIDKDVREYNKSIDDIENIKVIRLEN